MRRMSILALAVLALVGFVAPLEVFAQAPAAAPAPTFTITGFIDNVATYTSNMSQYDVNLRRNRDTQAYGRTRGRFDIIGQVGPAKAIFGFEIDSYWGQTGFIDSNNGPGCVAGGSNASVNCGAVGSGSESSFDINTDTQGNFQVKWLYTEFPMPLVPFPTIVRLGAQPFATAATYKLAVYANGDFPGVNLYTTFSPTFKLQLTYVAIDENLTGKQDFPPVLSPITGPLGMGTGPFNSNANQGKCTSSANLPIPCNAQSRGDNFAFIVSPEITPFKGLDVKPMYSYVFINGVTNASTRPGRGGVNGQTFISGTSGNQVNSPFNPANTTGVVAGSTSATVAACGAVNCIGGADGTGTGVHENRHTIGVDTRYRMGPFQLDPTFLYQFGSQQKWLLGGQSAPYGPAGTKKTADISAWLVDVRGGFQLGPLLLQSMVMWTSGNRAQDNPYSNINYFQALDTDSSFASDWGTQILSLGIDYYQGLNANGFAAGLTMNNSIGYDKYGRIFFGAKASYAITPALTVGFGVTPNWTDKKVDTDAFLVTFGGLQPAFICRKTGQSCRPQGESNYLGTELNAALTYRFAPGLQFDWAIGYLFTGNALSHRLIPAAYDAIAPTPRDIGVSDVFITTARVRLSF